MGNPTDQPDSRRDHTTRAGELLKRTIAGDADASANLMPLVYDELRGLAAAYLAGERSDHTLQATALVHEAWVRLKPRQDAQGADREHFLALAAQTMRRVLVDHARRRATKKRGGSDWSRVTVSMAAQDGTTDDYSPLEFGELLERLGEKHRRLADIATMRLFGGLEHAEIARVLDLSESTVYADWHLARAWLVRELESTM